MQLSLVDSAWNPITRTINEPPNYTTPPRMPIVLLEANSRLPFTIMRSLCFFLSLFAVAQELPNRTTMTIK